MKKINWNNVKSIAVTTLGEQGKALFVSPILYSLIVIFVTMTINYTCEESVEDTIMFTLPLSMIIPSLVIINRFISSRQVQRIATLPATNIEKYTAMISSIAVQSFISFVIMFVTDIIILILACKIVYDMDAQAVLKVIFDIKYFRNIVSMMYIASLVGWWKIAARTSAHRRYVDYALILMSFVFYVILFPIFGIHGVGAVVVALAIYSVIIILLAMLRSYYNFRHILTEVNQ